MPRPQAPCVVMKGPAWALSKRGWPGLRFIAQLPPRDSSILAFVSHIHPSWRGAEGREGKAHQDSRKIVLLCP